MRRFTTPFSTRAGKSSDPCPHAVCLLLVYFVGVPVIVIARNILYVFHPAQFDGTVPSISETAAFAPGSAVFMLGMSVVAVCAAVSVQLIVGVHRARLVSLGPGKSGRAMYWALDAAYACGMLAALNLFLLSNVNLTASNRLHMGFSIVFFVSEASYFIFDAVFLRWFGNTARAHGVTLSIPLAVARQRWTLAVVLACAVFLFLFLVKDRGLFVDRLLVQHLYTMTEMCTSFMLLAFAGLCYPDVKLHYCRSRDRTDTRVAGESLA